jgi:tartrate dehydrogenase/decarboxylase/D-malate dehydrogenase
MYEPVHGSAFDLVGRDLANPIGMVLSAAMMLDDLGRGESAGRVRAAVASACAAGILTPDVGGSATTSEVSDAILRGI